VLDTHACAASIEPGVNLGSGTVQKPLDLSMSIFRQCCAEATVAANRTVRAIRRFGGVIFIIGAKEDVAVERSQFNAVAVNTITLSRFTAWPTRMHRAS
jgi:hypothetical protein